MDDEIIFYTSHCPRCTIIKKLMDKNNVKYKEIDNKEIYVPLAKSNNIDSMPFGKINGEIIDAKTLQNYIMKG